MDALLGLCRFVEQVERHEAILEASERIQVLDSICSDLRQQQKTIQCDLQLLTAQLSSVLVASNTTGDSVTSIQASVTSYTAEWGRLNETVTNLNRGLLIFKPITSLTLFCLHYPFVGAAAAIVVPGLAFAVYALITYGSSSKQFAYSSYSVTAVTAITALVKLYEWNKSRRRS
jgi:hypothetical protein